MDFEGLFKLGLIFGAGFGLKWYLDENKRKETLVTNPETEHLEHKLAALEQYLKTKDAPRKNRYFEEREDDFE